MTELAPRRSRLSTRPPVHPSTLLFALLTPLLEKNPTKTLMLDVPFVFSMSRVIVLGFAAALLRQIWRAGIAGWPDATLSIAIVLALPIVGALDRATPRDVVDFAKAVVGRFGIGGARGLGSVFGEEPSKFDDHRNDGGSRGSPSAQ
jgi:hypothetical protein